jgi:UDP:flavonoid glycosyltransferase YjiC (YdhE family)
VRDAGGRIAVRLFKQAVFATHARRIRPLLPRLYRPDGSEAIYSPHKILGFGLTELEFDRDWPSGFEMIGPVFGALEEAPPPVLPRARKYVLASLGTHLQWAKRNLVESVTRLAQQFPDWYFLVTLGRPQEAGAAARQIAPNAGVVPFVAYDRDLPRFDIVIHHGGSGVSYACIAAGVPSLVVPHDYDQFDYAARLVFHRLGDRVAHLSDPEVVAALRRLADRARWPALDRFKAAAARYRPHQRFLAAVQEVTGRAAAASHR